MKLVSFDVGLRNLAVCILEGTSRKDVKIVHWDLIDVMAEMNGIDHPLCIKCKKAANWKLNDQYACTKHKSNSKTFTKTSLMKLSLDQLKEQALPLQINGRTKKSLVDGLYTHYATNVWKRCIKSCKQGSVVDLASAIKDSFDARKKLWEGSDLVIFEQQPDKRMMAVQAMMHMWFVCEGYKAKGVSAVH
jgi:hypothetical protein